MSDTAGTTGEKVELRGIDWVVCVCGNEPHTGGFYAYANGREVEPVEGEWDGIHYFCTECNRVFDINTGIVTERPADIPLLP